MKRREFLSSAGAAAALPVLPLPAKAIPVATAPANASKVGWAALYARAHAKASPALIQQWLGVGPEQAHAIMSELLRTNVLNAPVGGVASVMDPMFPKRAVPGTQPPLRDLANKTRQLLADHLHDPDEAPDTEDIPEEPPHETS